MPRPCIGKSLLGCPVGGTTTDRAVEGVQFWVCIHYAPFLPRMGNGNVWCVCGILPLLCRYFIGSFPTTVLFNGYAFPTPVSERPPMQICGPRS